MVKNKEKNLKSKKKFFGLHPIALISAINIVPAPYIIIPQMLWGIIIMLQRMIILLSSMIVIVPRAPEKEDLNARELLCRADSAGPVSPTCFDV
jgi:hypothetical protein